jgi:hypothetical protein
MIIRSLEEIARSFDKHLCRRWYRSLCKSDALGVKY